MKAIEFSNSTCFTCPVFWPRHFSSFGLDEAARLVFAPSSHESQAQHFFRFAPQGSNEKMDLWARLVEHKEKRGFNCSYWHRVALWPEGAEEGRVFFVGCSVDQLRETSAQTFELDWEQWQKSFEKPSYFGHLGRYWATEEQGETRVLRLDASDYAFSNVFQVGSEGRFVWRPYDKQTPPRVKDLRFMKVPVDDFDEQMRAQWNNLRSPIRLESDWWRFSRQQRDAFAFRCENGEWDEFLRLARLVLTARFEHQNQSWGRTGWNFFCYVPTAISNVQGESVLENDDFLVRWRAALFDFFRPIYARNIGFCEDIPECVKRHFQSSNPRTQVEAEPSQHEVLEAQLELATWARHNLSQHHADELLALR